MLRRGISIASYPLIPNLILLRKSDGPKGSGFVIQSPPDFRKDRTDGKESLHQGI